MPIATALEVALHYRGRLRIAAGTHRAQRTFVIQFTSRPSERFDVAAANPEIVAKIQAAVTRHNQRMVPAAPLFDARLTPGG